MSPTLNKTRKKISKRDSKSNSLFGSNTNSLFSKSVSKSNSGTRRASKSGSRSGSGSIPTGDDYIKKKDNLNILLSDIPRVWNKNSYSIRMNKRDIKKFITTGELNYKYNYRHIMFHPDYGIFKLVQKRWEQNIYYKQSESFIYKILSDYLITNYRTTSSNTIARRGIIIQDCFYRITNAINIHSSSGHRYIQQKINEEMSNFINEIQEHFDPNDDDVFHFRIKMIPERIIVSLCSNILPPVEIIKLIDTICRANNKTNTHFIDNLINFCCNVTKLYLRSQKETDFSLGSSLRDTWMYISDRSIIPNFKKYLTENTNKYIKCIKLIGGISPLHNNLNNFSNREKILKNVANKLNRYEWGRDIIPHPFISGSSDK